MTRAARWRRRGKWVGTVMSGTLAALWLLSGWWELSWWCGTYQYQDVLVRVQNGQLWWLRYSPLRGPIAESRWPAVSTASPPGWRWRFAFEYGQGILDRSLAVPLWIPFLISTVPAAYLWLLDRRRPPGSCPRCGYDLTGVPGGWCPECGAKN